MNGLTPRQREIQQLLMIDAAARRRFDPELLPRLGQQLEQSLDVICQLRPGLSPAH